jgi:hypothetical protein
MSDKEELEEETEEQNVEEDLKKAEEVVGPGLEVVEKNDDKVPYHGAEELNIAVRKIIFETPDGAMLPMSSNLMMKTLVAAGMKEGMASKLNSQIRKGAPLHVAWKVAFSTGKFIQKTGRGAGSRKKRVREDIMVTPPTLSVAPLFICCFLEALLFYLFSCFFSFFFLFFFFAL